MYGLEIVEASDGAIKRGTVYVTLSRMEDKGLIMGEAEPYDPKARGIPRRMYTLTKKGRLAAGDTP